MTVSRQPEGLQKEVGSAAIEIGAIGKPKNEGKSSEQIAVNAYEDRSNNCSLAEASGINARH